MKIYIDNNGKLFDGYTCDTTGMTLCELDDNGKPYEYYNLDGTPDTVKIIIERKKAKALGQVNAAKANIDATNVAVTVDMFELLSEDEQAAIKDFRTEQLRIIKNGGSDDVDVDSIVATPELQAVFTKLNIVTI